VGYRPNWFKTLAMRKEWIAHDSTKSMIKCLERVGDTIWSASPEEQAVRVWDAKNCTLLSRILVSGPVNAMGSLGSSVFISLDRDVVACDASLGEKRGSWQAHKSLIQYMYTDRVNERLWTFSDREVRIWNISVCTTHLLTYSLTHSP
jgi:hypothetical protein